jgi:hopene-associated glycosyltransferase HpnB
MWTILLVTAGVLPLAAWLYLLAARGGFWRVRWQMIGPSGKGPAKWQDIAVVIPARNEAAVIGRTLAALSPLEGIRIILVDDESTDGTANAARSAWEADSGAGALRILPGKPLPSGWAGKLWAVAQGIEAARPLEARYLLLTDADIVHSPAELSALLELAETGGYDLASLMVKLRCDTFAEKLLIPAFVFFFLVLYPPRWIASPGHKAAGAAGGCVLIRPGILEKIGGIAAIRGEIIDDCALGKAVKRCGGKVWLGLARQTACARSYGSFAGIGRMISRSAFNQLGHSALLLLAVLAGLAITFLLPVAVLFSGHALPVLLGLAAWSLMTVAYLPMVRYYRRNPLWACCLPVIALFYAGASVHSAFQYWRHRGGEWKGRIQDQC